MSNQWNAAMQDRGNKDMVHEDDQDAGMSLTEQVQRSIEELLQYGVNKRLMEPSDCPYVRNALLDLYHLQEPHPQYQTEYSRQESLGDEEELQSILRTLLDYGHVIGLTKHNTVTERDLLDARITGLLLPRPSETIAAFKHTVSAVGIEQATTQFYNLCIDSNYIRMDRVRKNSYWRYESEYGSIEMTINMSKPEKSPKEILEAKKAATSHYPKCLLCADNVGYEGHVNHPARQNLRQIPIELEGESWYFQYSPYVYYNEHSIVLHHEHVPMKLTKRTFERLLAFTEQFPHYFIGSNADLPIVGGSILSHDHFQAGRHTFAIENARVEREFCWQAYPDIRVSIVRWPMSVLRLTGSDHKQLAEAVHVIYECWQQYSDPAVHIHAFTDNDGEKVPHNTVTPIVRRRGSEYEADIVLRNNVTSEEHPEGIYHPHREMHHLKKENIGLIEVMGLAILPARLQASVAAIVPLLTGSVQWESMRNTMTEEDPLHVHRAWIDELLTRFGTAMTELEAETAIKQDMGRLFVEILGQAGVYKQDDAGRQAFYRFAAHLGLDSL
nr:UDP-glucose--hexose-1-phosphate uridylyltransferase [Paenibacillus sp. 1001270B_150601_E10]